MSTQLSDCGSKELIGGETKKYIKSKITMSKFVSIETIVKNIKNKEN